MPKKTDGPSKTRTIRINEDVDSVIQSEAERLGMSPNALINRVLLYYKDALRFDEPGSRITITRDTFRAIIDNLSSEEIEDIANKYGSIKLREHLLRRGMEINYENTLWHIGQLLGEYSGWFRCQIFEKKNEDTMDLHHSFGRKWSHFLVNYISSIIHGELGLKVQSVVLENNVHLTITK